MIDCDSNEGRVKEAYGNWSVDTDETTATLTLQADGQYQIEVASAVPDSENEYVDSVQMVEFFEPLRGNDCGEARRTTKDMTGIGNSLAATPRTTLRGQLNPADPGNMITWELIHEGPIRLSARE